MIHCCAGCKGNRGLLVTGGLPTQSIKQEESAHLSQLVLAFGVSRKFSDERVVKLESLQEQACVSTPDMSLNAKNTECGAEALVPWVNL